jgi:hypothetical protein
MPPQQPSGIRFPYAQKRQRQNPVGNLRIRLPMSARRWRMPAVSRSPRCAGRDQATACDPAGLGITATSMSHQRLVRQRADCGRCVALPSRRRSLRHQLCRLRRVRKPLKLLSRRGSSPRRGWCGIEKRGKRHDKNSHPGRLGTTERCQDQRKDQSPPPAAHSTPIWALL